MKTMTALLILIAFLNWSCKSDKTTQTLGNTARIEDSLTLLKMINVRENAMKQKDIIAVMTQFSDDATFINSEGYFCMNKKEIEKFHNNLVNGDSIGYYYKAGNVYVRFLDGNNALVYYPWRMDWFNVANPNDTVVKEVGLMSLTAQKRNKEWLWVAITNQHTSKYFDDLSKHKFD
jgi:hypothetical protein